MKKTETTKLISNICHNLMVVKHEFDDKIGQVKTKTKCFVSQQGNHVLILRSETENDCLVIIKFFYPGHPEEREVSYFIIDDECFDYQTKKTVNNQEVFDSIFDYHNNYYQN
jgi:dihydroxyacid dehydratase/phosphogluconate dehydratase